MFHVDVAAQAQLEKEREITGILTHDQRYYFRIIVTKDKNGVLITVSS